MQIIEVINHLTYIKQDVNQGKGAVINTGIAQATGDYLWGQDADFEYETGEYNPADVVYGSRFTVGKLHRIPILWHSISNPSLTLN